METKEQKKVTPQDWYKKHGLTPDKDGWFDSVPQCKKLSVENEKWLENIAHNIQLDVPNAVACDYNPKTMVMVCGGVSAKNYLEEIRAKALDPAYDVFCSNKTGEWLLQNGIIPQYHMIIDSRKSKLRDVSLTHPDVTYLLALNVDPSLFEALKDNKVKKFFCPSNIGGEELDRKEVEKYITEPMLMVCGGTMAGVRAITLAEGLGYRELEYYGFDACIESKDVHYAYDKKHNEAILTVEAEDGRQFLSTHIFADQVEQVMYWRMELPWVKVTVHGDSFMSHMLKLDAEKHKPKHSLLVTPEYLELQKQMHEKENYGISGHKHAKTVHSLAQQLSRKYGSVSVLDYGCGQSTLKKALEGYPPIAGMEFREYDPSIEGKDSPPEAADLVVCSDVMEHIEPECLANVLDHIKSLTNKLVFFWIDTAEAVKVLPDGRNAHISIHKPDWWYKKIKARFIVAESSVYERSVAFVGQAVALTKQEYDNKQKQIQTQITEQVLEVRKDGTQALFLVVNDTTKYRVDSLFIKEPVTIDWINRMKPGEVLLDIGANVGSYSIWAGCRGIKVFAFEPASQNYDLLCRNIVLNDLSGKVKAYCAALSNELSLDNLYLSERSAGASCNELGESVGPNLQPRRNSNVQGCIGLGLDALVRGGHLPQPDHIKIDVDGFEHRVVAGGIDTIRKAKSLLIEINENLEQHKELVKLLSQNFEYKKHQVDQARRLSGPFKGCAEYLFTRERDEIDDVIDRIMSTPLIEQPFPHIYLKDVFSDSFYAELLKNLEVPYIPISEARDIAGYPERSVHDPKSDFWQALDGKMRDGRLKSALCAKLGRYAPTFRDETLLIKDIAGYNIGPHTDSPHKVLTAIFYLPKDDSMPEAGTSIYVPKQRGVQCAGERHYFFEDFNRVSTMPYVPNSMFAFLKNTVSFHGVEPHDGTRNTLLYDIRTQ